MKDVNKKKYCEATKKRYNEEDFEVNRMPKPKVESTDWYNENNDILIEDQESLLREAKKAQFGEGENLISYLSCEAFESRYSPERARAFRLAAMIISRI